MLFIKPSEREEQLRQAIEDIWSEIVARNNDHKSIEQIEKMCKTLIEQFASEDEASKISIQTKVKGKR